MAQFDSAWQTNWQNCQQAHHIVRDQDNNILVIGNDKKGDKQNVVLAILDKSGKFLTNTIVKTDDAYPEARAIVSTKNDDLFIVGSSRKASKGRRYSWLAKINPEGQVFWEKKYPSERDNAFTFIVEDTRRGGFYLGGTNGVNFWVLKVNEFGEEIKGQKTWSLSAGENGDKLMISSLLLSPDGKHLFAIGSKKTKANHTEGVLCRWDTEGDYSDWEKTYPNTQLHAAAFDTQKEALILTGSTWNAQTGDDMLVLLAGANDGTVRKRQTIPLDGSDYVTTLLPRSDGYYLVGNSTSQERGQRFEDICLIAIDASGNPEWTKPLYYGSANADKTIDGTVLQDNSLVILGQTGQNNWIARFNTTEKINQKPSAEIEAIWDTPQYNPLNKGILISDTNAVKVRVKVLSPFKLDASHFKIMLEDKSVRIAPLTQPKVYRDSVYTYYETTVFLEEGENRFNVQISYSNSFFKTSTLTIQYDPRPNLYIVALGIKTDLHYTEKDATDFASFFQNTPNELFKKTVILLKNDSISTTDIAIASTFKHLEADLGKIRSKDVLIVFASSHGQTDSVEGKKVYYIQASNTSFDWSEKRPLDFNKCIVDPLKNLDCKKILLIDACESGAIGEKGSKTTNKQPIINLLKEKSGLWCMTSSIGTSYEDSKWENGAFSEAILQAFKTPKADTDKDGFLSFDELFGYVSYYMPQIVAKEKDNKEQKPSKMSSDNRLGNFPIFKIIK